MPTPPQPSPKPPGRVTPQKVRAVLRKSPGIRAAKWHRSGQIRGWGSWDDGYKVAQTPTYPKMELRVSHILSWREQEKLASELFRIAAGIACEVRDGAVWVPVEQQLSASPPGN